MMEGLKAKNARQRAGMDHWLAIIKNLINIFVFSLLFASSFQAYIYLTINDHQLVKLLVCLGPVGQRS